jgi:hypothetical protein
MQVATLIFAASSFVVSSVTLVGLIVVGRRIKTQVDEGLETANGKAQAVKNALAQIEDVL